MSHTSTEPASPPVPRLGARTDVVADPGDLLDHLGTDGFAWLDGNAGFVTSGRAAEGAPHELPSLLESIAHQRAPGAPAGTGPRAVGALPFSGTGRLVVPATIVGREADGRAWRTTIAGADVTTALHARRDSPHHFAPAPIVDEATWNESVERALAAIDAGELEKVVLARAIDVDADEPFDIASVLRVLRETQPGCRVYADEGFVGASPEMLVRRHGVHVSARPMAGTGNDPARLLASDKDASEHRIVVDAIFASLDDMCRDLAADGPVAVQFTNVTHLATSITGELVDPTVGVLDLVERLHPTPAVGGWPTGRANAALQELEPAGRGRYAGPCGWVDATGDGEFVVALRCAQLDGEHARLHAGAGIVAGSVPSAEWAETEAKLQPMMRALIRP